MLSSEFLYNNIMNKEEVLTLLKTQVLDLRDRSAEIQKDPRLMDDWVVKTQYLGNAVKGLNSCDAVWLNDEYSKWFKKEVQPHIVKLDPSLLDRLNS